jgi:hypothetical protein
MKAMKNGGSLAAGLVLFAIVLAHSTPAASSGPQVDSAYGTIEGVVVVQGGNTPVPGASVTLDGTRRGTLSDQNGEFTIAEIALGEHWLLIQRMGFGTERLEGIVVRPNETVDLKAIELPDQPIPLKEVVVAPGSYALMGSEPSIRQRLSSEDIVIMGWAEDISRAVQRSPGTVSDEYGAQFSIRGCSR